MNVDDSQILANVATGLANLVAAGIISREQAKGIVKPLLPDNAKNISSDTIGKTGGTITKQAVSTATDVK